MKRREHLIPDLTPLIDILFLLLIFFLVTSVFKKDELALLLDLPEISKGEEVAANTVSLKIELGSTELAIGGKKIDFKNADTFLAKIPNKMIPIDVNIDKNVAYERVAKLLEILQANNLRNISLIQKKIEK